MRLGLRAAVFLAAIALGFVLQGLPGDARSQLSGYGAVARVNGVEISSERLEASFQESLREKRLNVARMQNPERFKALKRESLDTLIDQELAWQAARKANVTVTAAEVDAALAELRKPFKSEEAFRQRLIIEGYTEETYRAQTEKLLAGRKYLDQEAGKSVKVTETEITEFYKENPDKFNRPEMLRVRQILVAVSPDASAEQRAAARAKIERVLKEARAGKDFAQLARDNSDDATRQWEGALDPIRRGDTPKPFEDAAFALKPGKISGVVQTPAGFHIIKLEERIPAASIPLDKARVRIRESLESTKREQAVRQELEFLRLNAQIEILTPL
ncbi:MAG TPA: peptidylprolyl isomerase [Burkholderiales bacterium]|nr:peptidylprolyl isomerase [Burkholderiales bacterium]